MYGRASLNTVDRMVIGRDHLKVCRIGDSCCLPGRFQVYEALKVPEEDAVYDDYDHTGKPCCVGHFREIVRTNPALLADVIDEMAEKLEKRSLL